MGEKAVEKAMELGCSDTPAVRYLLSADGLEKLFLTRSVRTISTVFRIWSGTR